MLLEPNGKRCGDLYSSNRYVRMRHEVIILWFRTTPPIKYASKPLPGMIGAPTSIWTGFWGVSVVSLVRWGAVIDAIQNGIKQATIEAMMANSTALMSHELHMNTIFIIGGGDFSPDRRWRWRCRGYRAPISSLRF